MLKHDVHVVHVKVMERSLSQNLGQCFAVTLTKLSCYVLVQSGTFFRHTITGTLVHNSSCCVSEKGLDYTETSHESLVNIGTASEFTKVIFLQLLTPQSSAQDIGC